MKKAHILLTTLLRAALPALHAVEGNVQAAEILPNSRLTDAQISILALPSVPFLADAFTLDAPAGPVFSEQQKATQRAAGKRILARVTDAWRKGADSVRISPGHYRFGKEGHSRDGVVSALQFTDLLRDAAHPFMIDASGATFWFEIGNDERASHHFCVGFRRCSNIIFKGATLDRDPRGNIEGRITQLDRANNRIELQLAPDAIVPSTFNNNGDQRLLPFKADGSFCAPLYALQRGGVHLKYSGILPSAAGRVWLMLADPALLDTVHDPKWIEKYGELGVLRVGDGISCLYTSADALSLRDCERLTMLNLAVHIAKGGACEAGGYGAHVWKNCYFGPRPGTSQWQGGDGFMFNGTRHGSTMDHVTILHSTDDILNIHGYWSLVQSVAGHTVRLSRERSHRLMPPGLAVGDHAIFLTRDTGTVLGQTHIVKIEADTVELDQPAAPFGDALIEWPAHACAGWLVQNCDWRDNYQRVLIQSGPGTLRCCTLARSGSGVEIGYDMPYVEGGRPCDIDIYDNNFVTVNPASQRGGVISAHTCTFAKRDVAQIENISVTNNTFDQPVDDVVLLKCVKNAVISGNRVVAPATQRK